MKYGRLFLLLSLLSVTPMLHATVLKWLVQPQYDHIGFYSETVFKCVKDGKVQLVDREGKVLLPQPSDSVTDYSDGYALVLEKSKKGYRICGILSERFDEYNTVEGEFYTERFSYCSEGFVSVANAKGKQGYVDVKGYPVIHCEFREARPFRKGWASVSLKEGEAHYIDKYGSTLRVNVTLTDASSFNSDGEALIGNYQKLLVINTSGEIVRKYKMEEKKEPPVRPYDYVYDEHPERFKIEHNRVPNHFDSRYQAFYAQGKHGVKLGYNTVALPQFDAVEGVLDGCAIVSERGHWGIVKLVEGDFSASIDANVIIATPGQDVSERIYTLFVPKDMDDVTLMLDYGDGIERAVALDGRNQYHFIPELGANAQSFTIRSRVMADGLLQWQNELTVPVRLMDVEIEVGKPFCTSSYANANDLQKVKAVVTNQSSFPVEVSTTVEVVLPSGSKNRVVSKSSPGRVLDPFGELDCLVSIKVVEEGWVKVVLTVTYEGRVYGSNEATLTLRPFY